MPASDGVLEIRGLTVALGPVRLVDGVSLDVAPGECHALVGESGSGKTLTVLSILRLLPQRARATGEIRFAGRDLLTLPESELRTLRGNRIAMIFQEPMSALNPLMRIGLQVAEPLLVHQGMSGSAAQRQAIELLAQVGISDPQRCARQYPHEISGGMRQRVMIAMALACGPDLLIADEPTTALDVTVQAQVLRLLDAQRRARGMALLFVTHDLAVMSQVADRVSVMQSGRIVEQGSAGAVLANPRHAYTAALLAALPDIGEVHRSGSA